MEAAAFDICNRLAGRLRAACQYFPAIAPADPAGLDAHIAAALAAWRRGSGEPPPGYAHSRRLYRACGIDPTRHRPSSEALWRRFRQAGEFPRRGPLIDLTNLLSLAFQVPYGLYDAGRIGRRIEIDIGRSGESYAGIGKETLSMAGKIVLRDESGPFGNPSSDSLRSAVDDRTRGVLQVIFFSAGDDGWREIQAETTRSFHLFFSIRGATSWCA